ncbi:ATP-binding cassette domain-containing protein [Jidongwangia harbinensis]|uniref:ATP-binding cassette domain-containing protein n=1 Tax=Jidongwangia harbinensis TaxID=2878561 RepID=UPI001CD97EA6|nr:ATP-binding cassette domain-containing protein [Jidongwangia harbinensis]MCA2216273.1 ATP-binding cassette domain-containing protein [Jidongwangia harbinensis]MCA2217008.1 ATP-binding cassette domain-containing protein [Jidongwangia harbinensis]
MTDIGLTEVSKSYGRRRVLNRVTLDVGTGVLGLLGPNGAGKTTLMRVLATVAQADAGRVELLGRDARDPLAQVAIRRRLGYVPQETGFPRGFTAFEYVDYVAILKEMTDRRTRHDEVRRVLETMGLTTHARRRVWRLSGGMKRRLMIAQALLSDPRLLILDEPTAGLDPEQRLRLRDTISTLAENRCVVVSTHQTEDVAAFCPRLVVLHEGSIRFDGNPQQLAAAAAGRVWRSEQRDPGARLAWRTSDGRLRQVGSPPPGATLVEPSIEDGYLLLVGSSEPVVKATA